MRERYAQTVLTFRITYVLLKKHTHINTLVVSSKVTGLEVNADKLRTLSCLEIRMQDEVII